MQKISILLSDELKSIMEEIKENSSVARLLLSEHNISDLRKDYVNYLSISNLDKTKISYLTNERMDSISEELDPWTYNKRFFARPASVVNKIFKDIHDKDLEIFNNLYKSILCKIKFTFRILNGNDVKLYYHGDRYRTSSGSLGNSCMKYDNCQRYMNLYVDNSDTISMLGMFDDDNLLMGRALLWNFDSNKVMDRIYTINDEELSYQFKKWANANGYMYKYEQRWNNSLSFEMCGKKIDKKFSVKLKNWKYDRYPYMDTFKFFDKANGILYNYNDNNTLTILCAPDGSQFDNEHLALDFVTGLFHHRGETVTISYMDGEHITNSTLRTYSPHANWSIVNNMYILKNDSVFDDELDDFIFNEKLDHLNDKDAISLRKKEQYERIKRRQMERSKFSDIIDFIDPVRYAQGARQRAEVVEVELGRVRNTARHPIEDSLIEPALPEENMQVQTVVTQRNPVENDIRSEATVPNISGAVADAIRALDGVGTLFS